MSLEAMTWAYQQNLPPAQKFLLVTLSNFADEHGYCYPSVKRLTEMTGLARSTVFAHLEALESDGYVRRETREREDGTTASNAYWLQTDRVRLSDPRVQQSDGEGPNPGPQGPKSGRGGSSVRTGRVQILHWEGPESGPQNEPSFEPSIEPSVEPNPPTPHGDPDRDLAPSALEAIKKNLPEIIPPEPAIAPGVRLAPLATFAPRASIPKPEPRPAIAGEPVTALGDPPGAPADSSAHGPMFAALAIACYGSTAGMTQPVARETHHAARALETAGYSPADVPTIAAWMASREPWRATTTPKTIVERAPAWRNDPNPIPPLTTAATRARAAPRTGEDANTQARSNFAHIRNAVAKNRGEKT